MLYKYCKEEMNELIEKINKTNIQYNDYLFNTSLFQSQKIWAHITMTTWLKIEPSNTIT